MLRIVIPGTELWDSKKQEFISTESQTLELEHSLASLYEWESKWHKSFLFSKNNTDEEVMDYVRCMTITPNVDPNVYSCLSAENVRQINDYINDSMTATTFSKDDSNKKGKEIVTAEIIYHWMISANVPFECQHWHLNRLITLLRVCSIKNGPATKMSKRDVMAQNAALNAARKKKLNTRG